MVCYLKTVAYCLPPGKFCLAKSQNLLIGNFNHIFHNLSLYRNLQATSANDRRDQQFIIHPRINYVSMLNDESFIGSSTSDTDMIAKKYLSRNQYTELVGGLGIQRTKSVKFEGIFEESHFSRPEDNRNLVSVNFSCNMSIATKQYMKKYKLLDDIACDDGKEKQSEGKVAEVKQTVSDEDNEQSETLTVLNLDKLKRLPKLL